MDPNHRQNAYKYPMRRRKRAVNANLFFVGLWPVASQRFRVWRFTPIREATIISLSLEVFRYRFRTAINSSGLITAVVAAERNLMRNPSVYLPLPFMLSPTRQ